MTTETIPLKLTKEDRKLLADPARRRAWIHYQLKIRDLSFAKVARANNMKPACLGQVWRITYPRAEKRVADALGLHPADLWPERYDKDGLPIYRGGPRPKPQTTEHIGEQP